MYLLRDFPWIVNESTCLTIYFDIYGIYINPDFDTTTYLQQCNALKRLCGPLQPIPLMMAKLKTLGRVCKWLCRVPKHAALPLFDKSAYSKRSEFKLSIFISARHLAAFGISVKCENLFGRYAVRNPFHCQMRMRKKTCILSAHISRHVKCSKRFIWKKRWFVDWKMLRGLNTVDRRSVEITLRLCVRF